MLPDILEMAQRHGLKMDPKTVGKKEVLCKCPFCGQDDGPGREKKFHLSLNTEDEVFKCWLCQESGGVYRFIALLEGMPESEVIERYRKKGGKGYKPHPAERLTTHQLRLLGYQKRPNWVGMRKRDKAYYKRARHLIFQEWKAFKAEQKRWAFQTLIVGIQSLHYQKAVVDIRQREQEIETPLLKDVLNLYSLSKRPEWTKEAEAFALHVSDPKSHPWPSTEKEMKDAQ